MHICKPRDTDNRLERDGCWVGGANSGGAPPGLPHCYLCPWVMYIHAYTFFSSMASFLPMHSSESMMQTQGSASAPSPLTPQQYLVLIFLRANTWHTPFMHRRHTPWRWVAHNPCGCTWCPDYLKHLSQRVAHNVFLPDWSNLLVLSPPPDF